MLIVGAKGFAKEVLQILYQLKVSDKVVFFDDLSEDLPDTLYQKFRILKTSQQAKKYFSATDNRFLLGIGNPQIREKLCKKMQSLGGKLTSIISPKSEIGAFNTILGDGINIMTGVVITNDVIINHGCLVNLNCTIGHDTEIGVFTELSPGVHISGHCKIGKSCSIGTGAVIIPNIRIGDNVTIGAGSVVIRDIEKNRTVAGVPAKIINHK